MGAGVVIVGGGQAGLQVATSLRQGGFAGDITLIGEEPYAPYQRPPLSKKYLAGELDMDRLLLRPASVYAENIALLTSLKAVWIDRASKKVRVEGGRELSYDALVLATGAARASCRSRVLTLPACSRCARPPTSTR